MNLGEYLLNQITIPNKNYTSDILKISHILIVEYLIIDLLDELENYELEWFISQIHSIFHNSNIITMKESNLILLQFRLSNLLRKALYSNCGEDKHLQYATSLLNNSLKNKIVKANSYELTFVMNELSHLIYILKDLTEKQLLVSTL